jgi:hypothetical protein
VQGSFTTECPHEQRALNAASKSHDAVDRDDRNMFAEEFHKLRVRLNIYFGKLKRESFLLFLDHSPGVVTKVAARSRVDDNLQRLKPAMADKSPPKCVKTAKQSLLPCPTLV